MVVESCKCGSAKRRPYRTTRFALPPLEVVALADARIACLARASTHRNPVLESSSAARGRAALSFPTLNQGSHARGVEQVRRHSELLGFSSSIDPACAIAGQAISRIPCEGAGGPGRSTTYLANFRTDPYFR